MRIPAEAVLLGGGQWGRKVSRLQGIRGYRERLPLGRSLREGSVANPFPVPPTSPLVADDLDRGARGMRLATSLVESGSEDERVSRRLVDHTTVAYGCRDVIMVCFTNMRVMANSSPWNRGYSALAPLDYSVWGQGRGRRARFREGCCVLSIGTLECFSNGMSRRSGWCGSVIPTYIHRWRRGRVGLTMNAKKHVRGPLQSWIGRSPFPRLMQPSRNVQS